MTDVTPSPTAVRRPRRSWPMFVAGVLVGGTVSAIAMNAMRPFEPKRVPYGDRLPCAVEQPWADGKRAMAEADAVVDQGGDAKAIEMYKAAQKPIDEASFRFGEFGGDVLDDGRGPVDGWRQRARERGDLDAEVSFQREELAWRLDAYRARCGRATAQGWPTAGKPPR